MVISMYNEVTKEASCNKCGYSWRSRGDAPKVCPRCTSARWQDSVRKFDVIIAKILPGEDGQHKFGIIPFVDKPSTESNDIFYITQEDYPKYFYGLLARTRCKINSAVTLIGDFEIGGDLILKIKECKLIFAFSQGLGREYVDDACIFNIRSFYEAQKETKRREEEAQKLAILEEERKHERLQEALKRIEVEAEAEKRREEARATLADESIPIEERMKAVAFLEKV